MYKVINSTMNEMCKRNEIQNIKQWKWTGNNIGAEGAAKISESLMTNTTLTELDLNRDDNIIKNIKQ